MHNFMNRLARAMAIMGGIVLSAIIILVCISVIGRRINTLLHTDWVQSVMGGASKWLLDTGIGPILGDFELVEAGTAFAIFAFIPLCQITGGHATVDIFTSQFPDRVNRTIQTVVDVVFAVVLVLIAWRLYEGMLAKMKYGETTFLLQFPVWWSYLASLVAACVAALVGVYMAVVRLAESASGRTILKVGGEVDH